MPQETIIQPLWTDIDTTIDGLFWLSHEICLYKDFLSPHSQGSIESQERRRGSSPRDHISQRPKLSMAWRFPQWRQSRVIIIFQPPDNTRKAHIVDRLDHSHSQKIHPSVRNFVPHNQNNRWLLCKEWCATEKVSAHWDCIAFYGSQIWINWVAQIQRLSSPNWGSVWFCLDAWDRVWNPM